jgi:hypothetical protein
VILLERWPVLLGLWSWVVRVVSWMRLEMSGQRLELENFLLKRLDHCIVADFFLHQLFIKHLVDGVQVLVQLISRSLDFGLHLRHDLCAHDFSELGLDQLPNLFFCQRALLVTVLVSLSLGLSLLQTHDVLLNSGQQSLAQMLL